MQAGTSGKLALLVIRTPIAEEWIAKNRLGRPRPLDFPSLRRYGPHGSIGSFRMVADLLY